MLMTLEIPALEPPATATRKPAAVELVDVSKSFGGHHIHAVSNVSLAVNAGEIVSILGPSGCGKTTTMRMIAGLENPTSGDIRVAGRSVLTVPPHRRNVGLVFQSLAIFPHMSVRQNVAFGLRMKGTPRDEIVARVDRALDLVQLPPGTFADRRPSQMSGGQLQRVALARTIVTEPALVLFDEPMAALDRRLRDHMAVELRAIQKALDIAAIYVTHDQETASMMSDRIVIMEAGRVVQSGTPADIYQRPANRFVAEFLGDLNSLAGISGGHAGEGAPSVISVAEGRVMTEADPGPVGARIQLLIRPEHVALFTSAPRPLAICARIIDVQFVSGFYRWRLRLSDGQDLVARTISSLGGLGVGTTAWLDVDPAHVLLAQG
jgi:ABC-type Fe3+/spermidine/putrescine transport system ATPase subunit